MPKYTDAQYLAALEACRFESDASVSRLITSEITQMKFNEKILELDSANPESMQNLFENYFSTEIWPDGQGQDLINQYATDAHLPFDFSQFIRTMQICDPSLAHECNWSYCTVPEGGRGNLPPIEMYRDGFRTNPDCIANIRHIKNFRYWAARVTKSRYAIDQHVIKMFTTLAVLKTLGHKWTLQGERSVAGNPNSPLQAVADSNPRNVLQGYLYNYLQPFFPQPTDPNNVLPLTYDTLQIAARQWQTFGDTKYAISTGPRGEAIFPIWFGEDWYMQEAITNPQFFDSLRTFMPRYQFAGFTNETKGEQEVIGNFAPKIMPWLPRLAEAPGGGLVPIDTTVPVAIEVGTQAVASRDYMNAPFGIAIMPSPQQGVLLKRPDLTTSGEGIPINPITGDGQWEIWNEYDKDCNPEKNMPYSKKKFEMGFQLRDPDAGKGMIYRRRKFRTNPVNECDLMPIFAVTPGTLCDTLLTVGGCDNNIRHQQSLTQENNGSRVLCASAFCSQQGSGHFMYRLKVERKVLNPDFNSLGCPCGTALNLFVYDEDGDFARRQTGTLREIFFGHPEGYYLIETATELASGECIKELACQDGTPVIGNVVSCYDSSDVAGTVGVVFSMTELPACDNNDGVSVKYYGPTGTLLGTKAGTIHDMDPLTNTIRVVTVTGGQFTCKLFAWSSITVECNGSVAT